MTAAIIEVSSIVKCFDTRAVIDRLDWRIMPGQVVGLLGRNGAGKSTLIECLLGLRETDSGSVSIFGEDGSDSATHDERSVFQRNFKSRG